MATKIKEKLYDDLAWIWPVMSPPEDYVDESEFFVRTIRKYAGSPVRTVLNLGCGGGHVDYTLKRYFNITGVDKSEAMLNLARKLNPEVTYLEGDMRSVRLGSFFDVVLVHDAISYMLNNHDLHETFKTAYRHLKPGGLFLTLVEETPEKFQQNKVLHYSHSINGLEVTSIEHYYDPDVSDTIYDIVFIYLIRRNKRLRIEVDNHTCGIFPLSAWRNILGATGFGGIFEESYNALKPYDSDFTLLVAIKSEK